MLTSLIDDAFGNQNWLKDKGVIDWKDKTVRCNGHYSKKKLWRRLRPWGWPCRFKIREYEETIIYI